MSQQDSKYFLGYQVKWLADNSRYKIWEKSRRIGATYVQSYEDVRDCVKAVVPAVWFSSADDSAAKEYIRYCEQWARMFDKGARDLGEIVIDKDKDIKSHTIEFSNGTRINALTSNPKGFRSKGGKVVLDEFAHHEDQAEMWKAAKPSATWGFPIRILSTHNGRGQFYKFVEAAKSGKLKWYCQSTDIYSAVEDGLVDKIFKKKATQEEKQEWLDEERKNCFDEITWLEEYCCQAQDEGSAFIDYELIGKCEELNILWDQNIFPNPFVGKDIKEPQHHSSLWIHNKLALLEQWIKSIKVNGNLFLGLDIGRRKDLTVIWLIEKLFNINVTRGVIVLEKMKFWVQEAILWKFLMHPQLYRACIDETGIGMQLAERAQDRFGEAKVEAINFASGNIRTEMAFNTKREFQDRSIIIPASEEIREDIHSIKKTVTSANKIRLEAENNDEIVHGHADRFWALSLALHAAQANVGPIVVSSRGRRSKITEGY